MSKSKTLISGCGISWSGQQRPTWVKVLKLMGANIVDLSGPAVSNNWILDQCALETFKHQDVETIILQLTNIGKLDVEINEDRIRELVNKDTLRNFTHRGIWPSSHSREHESKRLWHKWLYSPTLEIRDLKVKIKLFDTYCRSNSINLVILQGYEIPWELCPEIDITGLLQNPNDILYNQYLSSERYQYHDHAGKNSVPELGWQLDLTCNMCDLFWPKLSLKSRKLRERFYAKNQQEQSPAKAEIRDTG